MKNLYQFFKYGFVLLYILLAIAVGFIFECRFSPFNWNASFMVLILGLIVGAFVLGTCEIEENASKKSNQPKTELET